MITETDEVRAALAAARRRWPDASPAQLLNRLIVEGHASMDGELARRKAVIVATAGAATGLYGDGYLEQLRRDWDRESSPAGDE
jgi:hypothetical protein